MWRTVLAVAVVASGLPRAAPAARCPSACSCRWKYGKQTVECRDGGLRATPQDLDSGTQVLDLSDNALHSLPAETFRRVGLVNLQKIYLANCRLSFIDDSAFSGLTNLIELDLTGNALTAIPQRALRSVPALRELKLANNPVQRVDADTFRAVPGLVKLDISDCQILEVESTAFDPLTILEGLKISGNRLRALQELTVVALRRVHNVELHANPWECDCRLRPMQNWLRRNNIPYPVPPSCHGPPRVAGRLLQDLSADEFACAPRLLPMVRDVAATVEDNATLTCRVGAIPQPQVSWFWRNNQLHNDTLLDGGRRIQIVEEGVFERVSRLMIVGVRLEDAADDFHCVAANPAGDARTNFTLTVVERLVLLAPLDSGQIAGIVVGLIVALVVVITVVSLVLKRRQHARDDAKAERPPRAGVGGVINVETAPDDDVNPVQKPPRLTDIGYVRYGVGDKADSPAGPHAAYVLRPDLINEVDGRRPPAASYGAAHPDPGYGIAAAGYEPEYGTAPAIPPYPAPRGLVNPLADDSYELQQLPSTSGSDRAVYGYPADYGLPMPELTADGDPSYGRTSHLSGPLAERPLSTCSTETPLDSSREWADSGVRRRPWQMGAPVLPPLPTSRPAEPPADPSGTDV